MLKDIVNQTGASSKNNIDDFQSDSVTDLTPVLHVIDPHVERDQKAEAHPPESSGSGVRLQSSPASDTGITDSVSAVEVDPQTAGPLLSGSKPAQQENHHIHQSVADTKTKDTVDHEVQNIRANSRTIILKDLPIESDFNWVQSLIYGGAIESMEVHGDKREALVKFINPAECENYATLCSNGIKIRQNGKQHVVRVERSPEADNRDGVTQAYVDCGATRVVKVDGAKETMTMTALYEFAEGSSPSRAVEAIVDSYRRGSRDIFFRFANIKDAVSFRVLLRKDDEWKDKTVQFMDDPCEGAKGSAHH